MEEGWRNLLYPIGFAANLLFTLRFIVQWISSERKYQSHFTNSFWILSFAGSLLLTIHSFIQVQYPICIIQTCNGVLFWRNWQLSQVSKRNLMPIKKVAVLLVMLVTIVTVTFMGQSWWSFGELEWMRVPDFLEPRHTTVSFGWSAVGFCGTFLFASRFWLHWWRAEQGMDNPLKSDFWVISLFGSVLALCYFVRIFDLVNIIGYGAGMIPYARNLMLMRRSRAAFNRL